MAGSKDMRLRVYALIGHTSLKTWCERNGIDRKCLYYGNGRSGMHTANLCKLADALGCTTDYLLGRSER